MESDRETLRRWRDFGGAWRVIALDADSTTVSMCRCDGGEEVQQLTTHDPAVRRWLSQHPDSDSV